MRKLILNLFVFFTFLTLNHSFECNAQITWKWVKAYGGYNNQFMTNMVMDLDGNYLVTGSFWQEATFGSTSFTLNIDCTNGSYLAKFDSEGNLIWVKQIGLNSEVTYGRAIALDSEGYIYVTGSKVEQSSSSGYVYINKYSKNGDLIWTKHFSDYYWDYIPYASNYSKVKPIDIINDTICFLGGSTLYTISKQGDPINNITLSATSISHDSKNRIYSASYSIINRLNIDLGIDSTISLSPTYNINGITINNDFIYITGNANNNFFISKLNLKGQVIWTSSAEGLSQGLSIAIDKQNMVWVVGYTNKTVKFGQITLGSSDTHRDVFVAKYDDANGELLELAHAGGQDEDYAVGLAVNSSNNIIVGGTIQRSDIFPLNFDDILVPLSINGSDLFFAQIENASMTSTISGKITSNSSPIKSNVKLYRKLDDESFQVSHALQTNDLGEYSFTLHKQGTYLVKAENNDQIGTYYKQTYLWNFADPLKIIKDTIAENVNIDFLSGTILNGEDSISGKVFSYNGFFVSFIKVILTTKNDQFVNYTQTDSSGFYCFANVPKGQYKVLIDSAGTYMDSYYLIDNTVKSSKSTFYNCTSFKDCDYVIGNDHKIYKKNSLSVNEENLSKLAISIYPNPATTKLYIKGLGSSHYSVKVFDIIGNCVYKNNQFEYPFSIDISSLRRGYYLLETLDIKGEKKVVPFIKN